MTIPKLPARATAFARVAVAVLFTALVLGSGPAGAAACAGFLDVDDADPFCAHVTWIKNRNITLGCTVDLYCPSEAVTRLQMAAFMHRLGNVTFQQGGNAFGTNAVLGTTDDRSVDIRANDSRVMRYDPTPSSPNLIGGDSSNGASSGRVGQTIGGGGRAGADCYEVSTGASTRACMNFASDDFVTIGGGVSNFASGQFSTVGGGLSNSASGTSSIVAGGEYQRATANYSTIGGGQQNLVEGPGGTVGGGATNSAAGAYGAIGGGQGNEADASHATVGGGFSNTASNSQATIAGGHSNLASGVYATVPGGYQNKAIGNASFVAGRNGTAAEPGMFVWSDSYGPEFNPALYRAPGQSGNTFNVRATGVGGVWFVTGVNAAGTPTWACYAQNGSGWTCASDRNLKRNLEPLEGTDVLEKVAAMPIYRWQPKDGPNADVKHVGPMAQDFHAAFGLGDSDKAIGLQDADGVALAAIKGLYHVVRQQARDLETLRAELAAQRAELASRAVPPNEGVQPQARAALAH